MKKQINSGYGKAYSLAEVIELSDNGLTVNSASLLKSGSMASLNFQFKAQSTDTLKQNVYKQVGTLKPEFRPAQSQLAITYIADKIIGVVISAEGLISLKSLNGDVTTTNGINVK